ncbi:MAG: hypothetical protein IJB26_02830 [Clostridia bacterium]|nr:hypothetical protein [Clostridia bacterium]
MLENVLYKLKNREKITVGYFGGSITEGAHASDQTRLCWRALTTTWLREQFPNCEITEIQGAIGGTGSVLGVYRCDRDLIAYKPDLVFYEFSVNDYGVAKDDNCEGYKRLVNNSESIFRKIYKANPTADIVVMHTMVKNIEADLVNGKNYSSRAAHTAAARYYGLPCIEIGEALRDVINRDGGDWKKYTTDTVHPRDNGHAIYADVVKARLTELFGDAATIEAPVPKVLPEPLFAADETYENAHMADGSEATLGHGWKLVKESMCGRYPQYIEASEPGAELSFAFTGKRIGLYYMIAADSGNAEYSIDGGEWKKIVMWDEWALKFPRAFHSELATDLAYGEHTLRLRVSAQKEEQSTGTVLRIGTFSVG